MRPLHVTADEFFDRIATERPTANARKDALTLRRQILSQPAFQNGGRVAAERGAPLFPSLGKHDQLHPTPLRHVTPSESHIRTTHCSDEHTS